ncbi:MAG: hypothetical protein ACTSPY_14300 [Candidatus Helarchaeota archaeon]
MSKGGTALCIIGGITIVFGWFLPFYIHPIFGVDSGFEIFYTHINLTFYYTYDYIYYGSSCLAIISAILAFVGAGKYTAGIVGGYFGFGAVGANFTATYYYLYLEYISWSVTDILNITGFGVYLVALGALLTLIGGYKNSE